MYAAAAKWPSIVIICHIWRSPGGIPTWGGGSCRYPSSQLPMPSDRVSDLWQEMLLFVYKGVNNKSALFRSLLHCLATETCHVDGWDGRHCSDYLHHYKCCPRGLPGPSWLVKAPLSTTLIGSTDSRLTSLQMLSLQIRSSLLGILSQHRLVCVVRMWARDIGPMSRERNHISILFNEITKTREIPTRDRKLTRQSSSGRFLYMF